ncbi:DUF2207 domain-containing protein [Tissierella sp.]|uniref:DUF2207 domain-containing protein n=1 Tax=Tissierella sp. TaxID=41274 RepID=UPI002856AB04|nr:DUF2207 domain-containing protein [Tissierella sp.]MDR7855425.1 DUF2207 domain-containing protein [Tissierella sp.]
MFSKKLNVVLIIIVLIFISTASFAEDALSISRWIVDSKLIDNGDLVVSEDLTFNFKDSFNGVYRDIVLSGTSGINDLELYEMIEGVEVPYNLVASAKKGDNGVFTTTNEINTLNIIIFSPSKNESKTFRIKYTVKDVAINNIDTGELYYKFLGNQNSTAVDYFSATIKLPGNDMEKTKIFAHGPLNGEIKFVEGKRDLIKLDVSNVPIDTFIEARILFPKSFIDSSTNMGNRTFDDIMSEELSLIKAIEDKAISKSKNKSLFNNISIVMTAIGTIITGLIFNKLRRKADIYDSMNTLSPEDITPAELRVFYMQVIDSRSLMTSIFDLARKEYMSIEEIESSKKKKRDFQFSRTTRSKKDLVPHEMYLLDWLFNTIGDGDKVSTKDIEEYRNKNFMSFGKEFNLWQKKIREDVKARGYYDSSSGKFAGLILIASLLCFSIGITSLILEGLYGIALIILSVFTFVYGIVLFTRKSDKGHIQYGLWKDFKKNVDMQRKVTEEYDVSIPRDMTLIYALALGLPMKSLDNLRGTMPASYDSSHWAYWYFLSNRKGGSSFEDRFNSSFYGDATGTSSSSTGSGGGFSSGGGGGAGGGGAGGF